MMSAETFRSRFEGKVAQFLSTAGLPFTYEEEVIKFVQPAQNRRYTPDFVLSNGIILEVKGYLKPSDRQKHKWIKDQHPHLDIRFVFQNPYNKIYKGSKTRNCDWADKLGYPWCKGPNIPEQWLTQNKQSPPSKLT